MNQTTFEILFDAPSIDHSLYPEASMISKNSIVVDADNGYVLPCGDREVKLRINGEFKIYTNVWAVCPYWYNEG